ncbi:MAG: MBL fold metallo-hydrolase [Alphaproteobacteria bacterium]|jgi:glyoxylase-like metal-dependent hydrolase (beta-lactamase superfamily II)|nr:MBL fold metallo-hydrolase [Alphaproteobacteria bacterium]
MQDELEKPRPGVPVDLAEGLAMVLGPNPSPMTHWGTNTYLLGDSRLAVIDPGPDDPRHRAALRTAIAGRPVSHILVTHAHLDHSPLARPLSRETGAPVLAFGDARSGRSAVMQDLARSGLVGGGEGVDTGFCPDEILADGDRIAGDGWALRALHTPGHMGNHLCFLWEDSAFSGDHVMGWASSLVSPPDGDLTDFMAGCARLAATGVARLWPGHGAPVADGQARIAELIAHRMAREAQIRAALDEAPGTAAEITRRVYTDVPPALLVAAERNVLAHLIDLSGRGLARPETPLTASARFAVAG